MKRQNIVFGLLCIAVVLSGCSVKPDANKAKSNKDSGQNGRYNFAVTKEEKAEVEESLEKISGSYDDLYQTWSVESFDGSFRPDQMHEMIGAIADEGYSVICGQSDDNMRNYEAVSKAASLGKKGESSKTEFYSLNSNGGLVYFKLQFSKDGMTVIQANAEWSDQTELQVTYMDKVKVYDWDYTEKGWLMWEKEKSENQEMDMHCMYRVLPLTKECRTYCAKYITPVSYMGNNLFLTDWDVNSMEKIVWNDLFEFLYPMKYEEPFEAKDYQNGIGKDEMAAVIGSYFTVERAVLEGGRGYNKEQGYFYWSAMGSGTIVPQVQPFPEVTACERKEDGLIYLTVDAVSVEEGEDRIYSHYVVLREREDGGMDYMGNQILHREGERIPGYMPRNEQMR